jgi:hypothetical protein
VRGRGRNKVAAELLRAGVKLLRQENQSWAAQYFEDIADYLEGKKPKPTGIRKPVGRPKGALGKGRAEFVRKFCNFVYGLQDRRGMRKREAVAKAREIYEGFPDLRAKLNKYSVTIDNALERPRRRS